MRPNDQTESNSFDLTTQAGRAEARRASIAASKNRPRVSGNAAGPSRRSASSGASRSSEARTSVRGGEGNRNAVDQGSTGRPTAAARDTRTGSARASKQGSRQTQARPSRTGRQEQIRTGRSEQQAQTQADRSGRQTAVRGQSGERSAANNSRDHESARARVAARSGGTPQGRGGAAEAVAGLPIAKIALAAAAVVALLILFFAFRSCTSGAQEEEAVPEATNEPAIDASTTYDWGNLTRSNGRYAYSIDGEVVSRFGVDVSENNATIDWDAAAADGVEFAFIRVGYRGNDEGNIHPDTEFETNYQNAREAGIEIGLYFYSQAITEEEAREEARYCIDKIGGDPLEYPIAFDSETHPEQSARTDALPRGELAKVAAAFCEEVKAHGYKPLIYGSSNDLARYKRDDLVAYPVWYAEFGGLPEPPSGFTFWQFHNDAYVGGFEGQVDVNLDLTKAAEIIATQPKNETAEEAEGSGEAAESEGATESTNA